MNLNELRKLAGLPLNEAEMNAKNKFKVWVQAYQGNSYDDPHPPAGWDEDDTQDYKEFDDKDAAKKYVCELTKKHKMKKQFGSIKNMDTRPWLELMTNLHVCT